MRDLALRAALDAPEPVPELQDLAFAAAEAGNDDGGEAAGLLGAAHLVWNVLRLVGEDIHERGSDLTRPQLLSTAQEWGWTAYGGLVGNPADRRMKVHTSTHGGGQPGQGSPACAGADGWVPAPARWRHANRGRSCPNGSENGGGP